MTPVSWIVQTNLGDKDLLAALAAEQIPYQGIEVVPFSTDPLDLPQNSVVYGSTSFIERASRVEGTFHIFNSWNFNYEEYLAGWGERMLNYRGVLTTFKDLHRALPTYTDPLFLRPANDGKSFAGDVVSHAEFAEWYSRISHGEYTVGPDTEVLVAAPTRIETEWRLHMVAGKCVAASQYRHRGRLSKKAGAPPWVTSYAEEAAAIWSPDDVFVLDVGEIKVDEDEVLKIIEANCFNSAGFYFSDIRSIVRAVTDFVSARSS